MEHFRILKLAKIFIFRRAKNFINSFFIIHGPISLLDMLSTVLLVLHGDLSNFCKPIIIVSLCRIIQDPNLWWPNAAISSSSILFLDSHFYLKLGSSIIFLNIVPAYRMLHTVNTSSNSNGRNHYLAQ